MFCIVIFPFQNAPRPAWLRASANTADTANSEQTPSESMTSEDDEELQVVSCFSFMHSLYFVSCTECAMKYVYPLNSEG